MTGSVLLDVAIGIIFALLTFSLIASALQEAIASLLNWRGRMLRVGISGLLEEDLCTSVLGHGLIKGLHGPGSWLARLGTGAKMRFPSSIPAATFAESFIETLVDEYEQLKKDNGSAGEALALIRRKIDKIAFDDGLKSNLLAYVETATEGTRALDDVSTALAKVEDRIDALGLDDATLVELKAVISRVANGADSLRDSVSVALQALKDGIGTASLEEPLKNRLNGLVDHVENRIDTARAELIKSVDTLRAEIASCFDQAMDRVTGWYVRRAKYMLLALGFAMALATNFNLLGYAGDLMENDELRANIVARAEVVADTGKLGHYEIGQVRSSTSTAWYRADTGPEPDKKISKAEVEAILSNGSLGPLARSALNKGPDEGITVAEAQAAYDAAWNKLKLFDTDEDGRLDDAEANAAASAALADLQDEFVQSLATLNRELGDRGVPLGWVCEESTGAGACFWKSFSWAALLSWLIVGFGCTLGGQFWFDMLKNFLKVRTAAAGVKTDVERPATVS